MATTGGPDIDVSVGANRRFAVFYAAIPNWRQRFVQADLLIHADWLVPVESPGVLEQHSIAVTDGRITAIDLTADDDTLDKVDPVDLAQNVATVDTAVLILGESGTGKELVAKALHRHSPRSKKPFIALNMAAIPSSLAESLLFGHEKGSFTGADRRRQGRFELADGVATLTLDRPDQLNAFTGAMGESLGEAFRRCDEDDAVRVVVLTGAGAAFCAGADMNLLTDISQRDDDAEQGGHTDQP